MYDKSSTQKTFGIPVKRDFSGMPKKFYWSGSSIQIHSSPELLGMITLATMVPEPVWNLIPSFHWP